MSRERKAKSRSAYLKLPEFFERAAAFLTPIDDVPPDEWAADNRSYSSKTGEPGPRNARLTPYMVPFARRIWARSHASVIAITSAQSGKTDTLLDVIGQRLDVRPAPILYVGPGETFVETQFEPRLEHMLQQAKRLSKFVAPGKQSKTLVKKVRGVRVRLGYAGSPASMKSDPFAIGIVDEYDEMAANIKGQGDPWGLVVARGDTFADAVSVAISTCSQGIVETEKDPVNGLVFWAIGEKDQIASPIWRLPARHAPPLGLALLPLRRIFHSDAFASAVGEGCGPDDCGADGFSLLPELRRGSRKQRRARRHRPQTLDE